MRRRRNAERTYDVVKQVLTVNYARTIVLSVIAIVVDIYFLSHIGWTIFLQSRAEVATGMEDAWGQSNTFPIMRSVAAMAPLVASLALIRVRREAKSARMRGENISSIVMGSNTVLLVVVGLVAWQLLWLTYQTRQTPDAPCSVALQSTEWQALYAFVNRTQRLPTAPPSLHTAVRWIAQLGGFLARKGDGEPGAETIWKGLTKVHIAAETMRFLRDDGDADISV